ncbi:RNA polymerase sigma factor [Sphingopyxis sp. 550A]
MVNQRRSIEYSEQDKAVLNRLDRKFRRSLLTYFGRRTKDRSDLEDMVQDVFERLLKRGGASELERQNISAYVFETASSVLTDHLRKKITHRDHLYEPFDQNRHGEKDFSPEHVLIYRQQLELTSAMLLELPEETRAVFLLRRVEGMKVKDVAARLRISVSSVERHMRVAVWHVMQRSSGEQ